MFAELQEERQSLRLSALWREIAALAMADVQAAEEICYLPFLDGMADKWLTIRELGAAKDDICDAVADAQLRQAGSAVWWLAVRAARSAADRHMDCVESRLLPRARQQLRERSRRALGLQWKQFLADLGRDRSAWLMPQRLGLTARFNGPCLR